MANLPTRYARALFDISLERGLTAEYMEQAAFIRDTLKNHDFHHIITHPRIPQTEKHAFLDNTFANRIHSDLLSFMKLTVEKNREKYMASALDTLVETIRRHQNYTTAKVISAINLSEKQSNQLRVKLAQKLGRQVELLVKIDTSVIGGFRVHVDGHVFDHTLQRLLRDMKNDMKESKNDF